MPDPYANLIAGVVLSQELLIRYLEDEGVIEKGGFRAVLEEHLSCVSPERRDQVMYGPMRALVRSLGKRTPTPRRKH